ncbi:MAG: tetratricopeptide repeat protein, partial [Gammaproteobacteria bacterium]|nr:tetratricopeptide repeat protein [Gammaproteobacteria bacterium]
ADSGRRGEAEAAYQEALKIYRQLADAQPAVYLSDVATTLNNLSALLAADSGRRGEAEAACQEALKIYRQLADAQPAVYLSYVAATLNNLANLLGDDSGRRGEAEAAYQEALKIYRQLADAQPAVYTPDLANTLGAFGLFYLQADKAAAALVYQEEAIERLHPYARQHPRVFGNKQALILFLSAQAHKRLNQFDQARAALQEALPLAQHPGLKAAIQKEVKKMQ